MIELVYISTATKDFSDDELTALLAQARIRNTELGVTGMLLYANGSFMQLLEGEQASVEAIYSSIKQDPRNTNNAVMHLCEIDERHFPKWSMGFKSILSEEDCPLDGYSDFLNDLTADLPEGAYRSGHAARLLYAFKTQRSR